MMHELWNLLSVPRVNKSREHNYASNIKVEALHNGALKYV